MIVKIVVAIGMMILFTTGFFGLDNLLSGRSFHDVSSPLDSRIAPRPEWIWVYLLYYPTCFLPLFFRGVLQDDALYLRTALGVSLQFVVAWFIFYFYPTRIPRTEVVGDSWSAQALRGLYRVDPGYNIMPSLHVANSFFVAALSLHFLPVAWSAGLFVLASLISVSTVFTKQHYLADVPTGAALGIGAYLVMFHVW